MGSPAQCDLPGMPVMPERLLNMSCPHVLMCLAIISLEGCSQLRGVLYCTLEVVEPIP